MRTAELARNAINDYCLALDTGDFALLERTFDTDIVLALPGGDTVDGHAQVIAFFRDATSHPAMHRKHFTTNVTIGPRTEYEASGEAYFLSLLGEPGDLVLAWGRFAFAARRQGDAATLTRLELLVEQAPTPVAVLSNGA
jgi:ketosteroid isomerase-like protein